MCTNPYPYCHDKKPNHMNFILQKRFKLLSNGHGAGLWDGHGCHVWLQKLNPVYLPTARRPGVTTVCYWRAWAGTIRDACKHKYTFVLLYLEEGSHWHNTVDCKANFILNVEPKCHHFPKVHNIQTEYVFFRPIFLSALWFFFHRIIFI